MQSRANIFSYLNTPQTKYNGDMIAEEILGIKSGLIGLEPLKTSSWQSQEGSRHPEMAPLEIANAIIEIDIPESAIALQQLVRPNLPWAENHFQERVSTIPYNPPPSSRYWPYAQVNNAEHKLGDKFSHTYPERFWPKFAPDKTARIGGIASMTMPGIRFLYGDLQDVVNQLVNDPYTRQAYLPVFFPEDTGATSHQRVPCTLGYHFTIRPDGNFNKLHVNYFMRSCDIMRHMVDDLYMAARLGQWVREAIEDTTRNYNEIEMGTLTMFMSSLHLFVGDIPIVQAQQRIWRRQPKGFSHARTTVTR